MKSFSKIAVLIGAIFFLLGPQSVVASGRSTQHFYFLYDASLSYQDSAGDNHRTIWQALDEMTAHDKYSFAMIENCSFSARSNFLRKDGVEKPRRLSERGAWLDDNAEELYAAIGGLSPNTRTQNTDIEGALDYASIKLQQSGDSVSTIVIFSDLENDPARSCVRTAYRSLQTCGGPTAAPLDLSGIHVVVVDMAPTKQDKYGERFECRRRAWTNKFQKAGALSVEFLAAGMRIFRYPPLKMTR